MSTYVSPPTLFPPSDLDDPTITNRQFRLSLIESLGIVMIVLLGITTIITKQQASAERWVAVAVTGAAMAAAGFWSYASYRGSKRYPDMKFAFRCFTAAGAMDVMAHAILWGWNGVILGEAIPVTSAAYIFPITASVFAVVGCFNLARARIRIRLAGILDAILILSGTAFVGWALVLQSIYSASQGGVLAKTLALVPPSANILLIALLAPVALRVRANQRFITMFLLCALPILVSNVAFAYVSATSPYHLGTPIDCGYILTYYGAGLVSRRNFQFQHSYVHGAEVLPWTYVAIPYAPFVAAGCIFGYFIIAGKSFDHFLIISGVVIVIAAFVRQLLIINENVALSRELSTSENRFRNMAFHDALTGLPNRLLFFDRAVQLGELAKRSDATVSVLAIDLDGFKEVNDTYGHAAGDEVLKEVGRRLNTVLRSTDTAARMGGDEFNVIFIGGESVSITVAQRILMTLSTPYKLHSFDVIVHVGASIGKAVRKPDESIEELLRRADDEMYSNKLQHKAG